MLAFRIFFIVLFAVIFHQTVFCQKDTVRQRPKVAVALSGGSAKGLAHIGVLKAMEDAGLYPDIVTGTSMGSIVGSMYAVGYTPEQMEIIFTNTDWNEVFTDAVQFDKVNLEEKHDYDKYLMSFYLDDDLKPFLPQAAIHGHKIHQMLTQLLWPAINENDFTKLPRPFACVATDLLTGQKAVFTKGDLATSVRASMSIPTAFSPIEIGDKLLIDGGVVRNLPVQEAIDLGADIVIAVYTSFDTTVTKNMLKSLDDIIIRTAVFVGINDSKEQSKLADILIVPDLKNFSAENYKRNDEIIETGEKAGKEYYDTFKQIADSLDKIAPPKRIKPLGFNKRMYITDIGIEGNVNLSEDYIKYLSGIKLFQYYDAYKINDALERLYSSLLFHRIYYTMERFDGGYKIWFHVTEKPPKEIKIALNYSDFFGVGILSTITLRHLISNDKVRIPILLSENPIVGVEYEKYVGKKKASMIKFGFQFENNSFRHQDFLDNKLTSSGKYVHLFQNAHIGLYKGLSPNTFVALKTNKNTSVLFLREGLDDRFGYKKLKHYSLSPEIWFGHVSINRRFYPTKGVYAMLHINAMVNNRSEFHSDSITSIAIEPDYNQINTDIRVYFPLSPKLSTGVFASGGFSDRTPLFFDNFFIGGNELTRRNHAFNFIGLNPFSINTFNFLSAKIQFQYELSNNFNLLLMGNAGVFDEHFEEMFDPEQTVYGTAIGLTYKSFLGPISVCSAYSSLSNKLTWHINIGYPF